MKKDISQAGFSAVELLITLFIGFIFVMMGYQLLTTITLTSSSTRGRAIISDFVYNAMRKASNGETTYACPVSPATYTDSYSVDRYGAIVRLRVSCPNPALPNLRLVTAYTKYNESESTHATYFIQN